MKRITCTVDPAFAELMAAAAARSGRSLCQFMRTALTQWAREQNIAPASPPKAPAPFKNSRMGGWL
jgi:hypothetical protein